MSNFFELIERFKFGLLAALTAYIGIFMYLQMDSYTSYFKIEAFHDGSFIEIPPEDIHLTKDNIMMPDDFQPGKVTNMAVDANDDRESSTDDYSEYKSSDDVVNSVHDLEKQFYDDAGGDKERKRIQDAMNARDERENKTTSSDNNKTSQNTGDKKIEGATMVKWSLSKRTPHQNNNWYVRNPGYTCGYGSGSIYVDVRVNQNGNVVSATYNSGKSQGGNSCMIEQAIKYAKLSRFNYSSSASSSQTGWIKYIFVSQ